MGAATLRVALSASPWTAWLTKGPQSDIVLEAFSNWLANKGLLVLNLAAIDMTGAFDQKQFDAAIDNALDEIKNKGGREALTPAQIKAIDDEVIKAARKFVIVNRS